MAMVIMLMEKEVTSGFLGKEVGSYTIENHGDLLEGIFLIRSEENDMVHMRVTVDRDVQDWEYSAVYDEYNPQVFQEMIMSFDEIDDTYNPTWELSFEFTENQNAMERRLNNILQTHKSELHRIWDAIADKKAEYE